MLEMCVSAGHALITMQVALVEQALEIAHIQWVLKKLAQAMGGCSPIARVLAPISARRRLARPPSSF